MEYKYLSNTHCYDLANSQGPERKALWKTEGKASGTGGLLSPQNASNTPTPTTAFWSINIVKCNL